MTINKISYDKDNVIRMATKSYIDSLSDIENISNDVLRNGIANEINDAIHNHNIISSDSNLRDIEYVPNSSIADLVFAKYDVVFDDNGENDYGLRIVIPDGASGKIASLTDISHFYHILYDFKYEITESDFDMFMNKLLVLAKFNE